MAYWHISGWMKHLYKDAVWDCSGNGRTLYLTFDDGPTPAVTDEVLSILKTYQAKATFFCLGRNAERHPDILALVINDGHTVGNHTYSHLRGWKHEVKTYLSDVELASLFIKSSLFRPPYGQIRRGQLHQLKSKYKIVLWDVMSHDYENRISKERSLKSVTKYAKEGSIVVFHDSVKAWEKLKFILPATLKFFKEKGYSFKSI